MQNDSRGCPPPAVLCATGCCACELGRWVGKEPSLLTALGAGQRRACPPAAEATAPALSVPDFRVFFFHCGLFSVPPHQSTLAFCVGKGQSSGRKFCVSLALSNLLISFWLLHLLPGEQPPAIVVGPPEGPAFAERTRVVDLGHWAARSSGNSTRKTISILSTPFPSKV